MSRPKITMITMKTNCLFHPRIRWSVLVGLLGASLMGLRALAAEERGVLAAGGGPATAGVYALTDTAGQPVVGTASSANYAVADGFWPDSSAPVAGVLTLTRTAGVPLKLALSNLAANWSDMDGDPVSLIAINLVSTNGATLTPLNLTTNPDGSYVIGNYAFIGYANAANVNDQFSYVISDGLGDTTVGLVNLVVSTSALLGQATGIINPGGNAVTVQFAGVPGYTYQVERSTNLIAWVPLWITNAPAGSFFNYVDMFGDLGGTAPGSAYYRLSWTAIP